MFDGVALCLNCFAFAQVKKCLSIKGAEDAINKPHAFEISTTDYNMFFIADSDKVMKDAAAGHCSRCTQSIGG
jgi:citrate lyase alpha subunit